MKAILGYSAARYWAVLIPWKVEQGNTVEKSQAFDFALFKATPLCPHANTDDMECS